MTRVAAVDCGTNTIRLLVADLTREETGRPRLEPLRRRNEIVRLGQGVDRTGLLDLASLGGTATRAGASAITLIDVPAPTQGGSVIAFPTEDTYAVLAEQGYTPGACAPAA